jgi:hypothetical protein
VTIINDPAIPPANVLFPLTYDVRGLRLAIVLGNQAIGGTCPFAKARLCHHCDIGLGEGVRFSTELNLRRVEWLKNYYASVFPELSHLIIYNSGSTLNPVELSPEVIESLLSYVRTLPNLKVVSMDSRESFVTSSRVVQIASQLGLGRELRIILGVESADDKIRNGILEKRMSKRAIEFAVRAIASAREKLNGGQMTDIASSGLSINVIIGGPGTSVATAIKDAVETCCYSVELAENYGLRVDLNLHPYYPSQRAMSRFPDHPRASLMLLCEAIYAIVERIKNRAVLFVGLQDEGHDQQQARRKAELVIFTEAIQFFNKTGRIDHILAAL